MCGQVVTKLHSSPRSAGHARDIVAATCEEWQLGEICADVVLPVSELVTNAILHAQTDLALTVSLTGGWLEVSVRDHDPRPPVVRPVRLDLDADLARLPAEPDLPADVRDSAWHVEDTGSIAAGRGLHIVDAVADEWGLVEYADGKDVWFRVKIADVWQPREPCQCAASTTFSPGHLPHTVSHSYRG